MSEGLHFSPDQAVRLVEDMAAVKSVISGLRVDQARILALHDEHGRRIGALERQMSRAWAIGSTLYALLLMGLAWLRVGK